MPGITNNNTVKFATILAAYIQSLAECEEYRTI